MKKSLLVMAILVISLAACVPGQSPVDTQAQVNTAVAQTMESQKQIEGFVAQTVSAQIPASTATAEFPPTATETFVFVPLITDTVFPTTITPSVQAPIIQPTDTTPEPVTPASYSCSVINRSPEHLAEVKGGTHFDIKWIIVNIGSKTWDAGIDVKYSGGEKLTKTTVVEIPKQMKTNDSYTVVLDAVAPNKKGRYEMGWVVQGQYCYMYVVILVK